MPIHSPRPERQVDKHKTRNGSTATYLHRVEPRGTNGGNQDKKLVDSVIRHWHDITTGGNGIVCKAAAKELAVLFSIAADDKR